MAPTDLTGKLKSVLCRNFVTYEECVFKPNEFLNVIIGPNGTGKSTLVAAIVLGFGGEPKILNRSTSILDYIKNGKRAASIVIEIYNKASVVKLERSFSSAGKSEFKINGESMTMAKFLVAVSNFKIQIRNLCQFLPQDRVHDFAKMNPQELFSNTIKSVCSEDEIKMFENLKSLRCEQSTCKKTLAQNTQKLRLITTRLEELEVINERYTQRKGYVDKLNVCVGKKTWLEAEEIEQKLKEQSADKSEAEKLLQIVDREYTIVKRKIDAISKNKNKLQMDAEKKRAIANRLFAEDNDIVKKIDELMEIQALDRSFEHSKRELESSRQDVAGETAIFDGIAQVIRNMITQYGSIHKVNSQLQSLNERIIGFREEISKRLEMCANINDRLDDEYISPIQILKRRIERAEKNCKLELKVKMPNYDKYVENTIPLCDLLAFTCENKSDMSLLIDELCVKQRLGVNVLFSVPAQMCNYKCDVPMQNSSQYGFEIYLINILEGPASIMNYLCASYKIHQIRIDVEQVSACTDEIPCRSISRYSGEESLMQNHIDRKKLLKCLDQRQIEAMKKDVAKLLHESDILKNSCINIENEIMDIEVECEEARSAKRSIEVKKMQIKDAINRFKRQKEKIKRLQGNTIDLSEVEKTFLTQSSKSVLQLVELQRKRIKSLSAYSMAIFEKQFANIKITVYDQQSENLETEWLDVSERKRLSGNKFENIDHAMAISKRKWEKKILQAKSATNGFTPNDRNFPFENEFLQLPNSITELREHINEFKARLECLTDIDENSIKEYKEKMVELDILKNSINGIQSQENNVQTKIEKIFTNWYSKVEGIIQILNTQFSNFMSSMNFIGEINLSKKDNYDFDSYGIQILVQYRKGDALQALDRCRQSGGERAVAIAVYSLSMQHITHVPFRCVDEINQGMDSRNERKIFEMLVEETTKIGRSQYFFVTPKLLPGLIHNKRMMVHIVFNGKFVNPGGFN